MTKSNGGCLGVVIAICRDNGWSTAILDPLEDERSHVPAPRYGTHDGFFTERAKLQGQGLILANSPIRPRRRGARTAARIRIHRSQTTGCQHRLPVRCPLAARSRLAVSVALPAPQSALHATLADVPWVGRAIGTWPGFTSKSIGGVLFVRAGGAAARSHMSILTRETLIRRRVFSRKTIYSPVTTFQLLPGLKRSIWRARTPVVGPRSFS